MGTSDSSRPLVARGQTFGLEIEFEGRDVTTKGEVAQALHRLGLSQTSDLKAGQSRDWSDGKWIVKHDRFNTGEVVSPPLTDCPETWQQVRTVCDVIKKYGGEVTAETGTHVHVGIASSGMGRNPLPALQNLADLWGRFEDLLFRLGSQGGTQPLHRSHRNTFGLSDFQPIDGRDIRAVKKAQELGELAKPLDRKALSFSNLIYPPSYRTVEFRHHDGTLDADRIRTNVMLDCAITRAAASIEAPALGLPKTPLGDHVVKHRASDKLFEVFSTRILSTPEQRARAAALYAQTHWQGVRQL